MSSESLFLSRFTFRQFLFLTLYFERNSGHMACVWNVLPAHSQRSSTVLCPLFCLQISCWTQKFDLIRFDLSRSFRQVRGWEAHNIYLSFIDLSNHWCSLSRFINSSEVAKWWYPIIYFLCICWSTLKRRCFPLATIWLSSVVVDIGGKNPTNVDCFIYLLVFRIMN